MDKWGGHVIRMQFLYDVAFDKGAFVAVGDLGRILTSAKGVNWVRRAL